VLETLAENMAKTGRCLSHRISRHETAGLHGRVYNRFQLATEPVDSEATSTSDHENGGDRGDWKQGCSGSVEAKLRLRCSSEGEDVYRQGMSDASVAA